MLYMIYAEDRANTLEQRFASRPAHLARLQQLREEGRLLLAGPHPAIDKDEPGSVGFTGSIIIAEFNQLADAVDWAELDPYTKAGVYKNVTVKPFNRVF